MRENDAEKAGRMEAKVICKDYQKSEEVEKMAGEGTMETEELKNMLEELKQKTKDDKEQCEDMLLPFQQL